MLKVKGFLNSFLFDFWNESCNIFHTTSKNNNQEEFRVRLIKNEGWLILIKDYLRLAYYPSLSGNKDTALGLDKYGSFLLSGHT